MSDTTDITEHNHDEDLSRWLSEGGKHLDTDFSNGVVETTKPPKIPTLTPAAKEILSSSASLAVSSPPEVAEAAEENFTCYVVGDIQVMVPSEEGSNAELVKEAFALCGVQF